MKKQTAVDWLLDELKTELGYGRDMTRIDNKRILDEIKKEAKAMEKEQIETAYQSDRTPCSDEDAARYYNETYGGDK